MIKNKNILFLMLLSSCVFAQQPDPPSGSDSEAAAASEDKIKSRSGYKEDKAGFGGRSSVGKQLRLDDLSFTDNIRFPEFDSAVQPYYEWKRKIRKQHNLQFGQDYTALYQKASDSLTDIDSASAGIYRFFGRWLATGKEGKNDGALVFKIEHTHKYSAVSPEELNKQLGYLGSTGLLFSDLGWVLNDFNWQQRFDNDKGGFYIGRIDPNDYMDLVDYANPLTTFQNMNILENHSIAIPDTGLGLGFGYAFNYQWYIRAAVSDANGSLEELGFFDQGAEFFSYAEFGWTPAIEQRDLKDVHLTLWHVDQRVNENVAEGEGAAVGASWSFNKELVIFGRAGQSRGEASLMKRSATAGVVHIWKTYFDVFGCAVNYSEPVDQQLRNQTTMEAFLKIKLAQNIALTPSFQLLINPTYNPQESHIQVYGLRFRVTL